MDYTISSGDTLWNITKNNFKDASNKEISEYVDKLAKANNISNPDKIYTGQTLDLSIFSQENDESGIADKFDDWTNSEENYENSLNGNNVEGFQMFDFNASTYSSDLNEFSQKYIDKYDEDSNGSWSKEEFINMSTNGEGIPKGMETEFNELFDKLYNDLNLDSENNSEIDSGEFASYLYAADFDWNSYAEDLNSQNMSYPYLDGNLDYDYYQTLSSMDDTSYLSETMQEFYNQFYAE